MTSFGAQSHYHCIVYSLCNLDVCEDFLPKHVRFIKDISTITLYNICAVFEIRDTKSVHTSASELVAYKEIASSCMIFKFKLPDVIR